MSLMVDPTKDAGGSNGVSAGRKLAIAVGMDRWIAGTGTPMLTVGFVVVGDEVDGREKGEVFLEGMPMTAGAVFRVAGWAEATGWVEPFDALNDDHIQRIMARGPVVCLLKDETYKGKTRAKVSSFAPFSGQVDPGWDALTTAGEQSFDRIMSKISENRDGGSGGETAQAPRPAAQPKDDDIPF